MNSTYELMIKLFNPELLEMKELDLCKLYIETKRPDILATLYCHHIKAVVFWNKKYNIEDTDTCASIALECLDYCLNNFDGSTIFKTYFNNGLKIRFASQKEYEMCKKRNSKNLLVSIDEHEIEYYEADYENMKFLDNILNSGLSKEQINYCLYYLNNEKASDVNFMRMFGISRKKLKIMKLSLQNKFIIN